MTQKESRPAAADAIRPFTFRAPDEELAELRRRIGATRWPDGETVADPSQGVQLAFIQALARYWATDYNWRRCEAQLNSYPQFITEIDGLDIHFIHIRSRHENALPLIVTHGWPGSPIEQLKIIDPLTNPTAQAPRSWTERAYSNLLYYTRHDKGGHFAAWEQPQLLVGDLRTAFRSLR